MLLNLQSIINVNSLNNIITIATRSVKEIAHNKPIQHKQTWLEFPKFNGYGLHERLLKCNQYFEFNETLEETKVRIPSLHLKGRGLQCIKML